MQKLNVLVKALAASTAGLSIFASMSAAQAINLVPQQEGEIKLTNFNCLPGVPCIDTSDTNSFPFSYTVTSLLPDEESFGVSRLFSDTRSTANNFGFGINFTQQDEGTNPQTDAFWFRPVAFDSEGKVKENGRLEYGIFEFNFAQTANEVKLSFLDVEDSPFTSILKVNGDDNFQSIFLPAAGDDEVQNLVLNNVDSFIVQLGNPGAYSSNFPNTGDGVNLQVSVPEPGTIFSMGALAVAGMFGLRKRNKSSNIA